MWDNFVREGVMTRQKITKISAYNESRGLSKLQKRLVQDEILLTENKAANQKSKSKGNYHPKNALNDLTGTEWIQETSTIWYQRGLGREHDHAQIEKQHPAPFSYKMVERLIKFFTKKNAMVLDPFCGVGSTLKACALNDRKGIGIELSKKWVELSKKRLKDELSYTNSQKIIHGDARKALDRFDKDCFDFIVTSPPYWQILNKRADHKVFNDRVKKKLDTNYSKNKDDLGNIENYSKFLEELKKVFKNCYVVLKPGKYMVVVVSDFRHKSKYVAFHADTAKIMEDCKFETKSMSILVQNAKRLYPYGYPYDFVPNIHHQYLLIFKKPKSNLK